jgi:uncharacterized protein YcnI
MSPSRHTPVPGPRPASHPRLSASSRSRLAKPGAVAGLTAIAVVTLAAAAQAHVTVNPRSAEQGSYAKLSFRVPNERGNAATTELRVELPLDHPVASVSVRPVPGWTVRVDKAKLPTPIKIQGGELTQAVSTITWSGGKIDPGRFEEFDVSMGPLPAVNRMLFKAVQTYSGGDVVRWDQDPGSGSQEPEHPSPALTLTPKGSTVQAAAADGSNGPAVAVKSSSAGQDGTARVLGGSGLVVGVVGVGLAAFGLRRGRSRT